MNVFVRLGVLTLTTAGLAIAPIREHPAVSQERQGCFIVDPFGDLVDLNDICPTPEPFEGPGLGSGDVQVTLRWSTTDDLDLSVIGPDGVRVYWDNTGIGGTGGQLDRDDNAECIALADSPIENIFWPVGFAPEGEYIVEVELFQRCANEAGPIDFELQILTLGATDIIQGSIDDDDFLFTHIFSIPTDEAPPP
ncbi:MAG: hypothetical protein AB4042_10090 [Leptolyngbyaceae cyanobacterium]